jgi:hypothetical protein
MRLAGQGQREWAKVTDGERGEDYDLVGTEYRRGFHEGGGAGRGGGERGRSTGGGGGGGFETWVMMWSRSSADDSEVRRNSCAARPRA